MHLLKSEPTRFKALPPMHLRKDQFGRLLRMQYGPKIMQECVNQHSPYGPDCWDGGVTELPIRDARRKHLNKLRRYWQRTQLKPVDTTKVNVEHPHYPGHYFYPFVGETDLVELALIDRMKMLSDEGNYMVMMANLSDQNQRTDALCACDNARIPTHRSKDTPPYHPPKVLGELTEQAFIEAWQPAPQDAAKA